MKRGNYDIKPGDLVMIKKPRRPHHRFEIFRVVKFGKSAMRSGRLFPTAELVSVQQYKNMGKWIPTEAVWNLRKVSPLELLAGQADGTLQEG